MRHYLKDRLKLIPVLAKDVGFDLINSLHYWRHNLTGNRVEKKFFSGDSKHPPVILLQGFLGTRGVLRPLEKYLRSHGRDVISLDLGLVNIGDIRESAQYLAYKIERILDRYSKSHDVNKIDIIGHSMGGLIGLYYVKKLGGHKNIRHLITLGAPFNGTWASLLALFPIGLISKGLWQMFPHSEFVKSLQSHPDLMHETSVTSIAAKYDTICTPKSCHLRGARNEIVPVGHASLLMDHRAFDLVIQILNEKSHMKVVPFDRNRSQG